MARSYRARATDPDHPFNKCVVEPIKYGGKFEWLHWKPKKVYFEVKADLGDITYKEFSLWFKSFKCQAKGRDWYEHSNNIFDNLAKMSASTPNYDSPEAKAYKMLQANATAGLDSIQKNHEKSVYHARKLTEDTGRRILDVFNHGSKSSVKKRSKCLVTIF